MRDGRKQVTYRNFDDGSKYERAWYKPDVREGEEESTLVTVSKLGDLSLYRSRRDDLDDKGASTFFCIECL